MHIIFIQASFFQRIVVQTIISLRLEQNNIEKAKLVEILFFLHSLLRIVFSPLSQASVLFIVVQVSFIASYLSSNNLFLPCKQSACGAG